MMKQAPSPIAHVFVYGTLRRGGNNDINRLAPVPRWVGRATVAGTLYDLGAYPGATLGGTKQVHGEVYAVQAALIAVLDEIEEVDPPQSDEYRRRALAVDVDGRQFMCWVYVLNARHSLGRPIIASGDWIAHTGVQ